MPKNCLTALLVGSALLLGTSQTINAQKLEFGVNAGITNYQGDLSQDQIDPKMTDLGAGAFFRYNWSKYLSFRTGFGIGKIAGTDANSTDPSRVRRNLSFFSTIYDGYLVGEISPFGFQTERRKKKKVYPYIFGGIGVFHFNPKTEYRGEIIELQPLGTEGQGLTQYPASKKYNLTQVSYPFGVGLRYNISRHWNIGAEVRWNKTYTDYLDDVSGTYANPEYLSTRGEKAVALSDRRVELGYKPVANDKVERGHYWRKDAYVFSGITLSYMPRKFTCYKF